MIFNRLTPFRITEGIVAGFNDRIEIEGTTVKNISRNKSFNLNEDLVRAIVSNCIEKDSSNAFTKITDEMHSIFIKKNHDYGNSFEQSLNEEGLAAFRIRGGDKWLRFKNLSKKEESLVHDESIRDTILDLANYCVLTLMWMDDDTKNL